MSLHQFGSPRPVFGPRRWGVATLLAVLLASGQVRAATTPAAEEPFDLAKYLAYGWSDARGPALLGRTFYGVGYRFEAARWALSSGRAPRLSGVALTLNRDFLLNIIAAVLIQTGEQHGRIADSGGYVRVGPVSDASDRTVKAQPFSLEVSLFDQALGSELNGAAADLVYTFVLGKEELGGPTLTVGLNATALGAPASTNTFAWVSWLGAVVDFRAPLFTPWVAARVRATLPFVWGRQGSLEVPRTGEQLPEDRRYLARVDAMLEGYVTNLFTLGAGVTWGVAQLGEGFGFRAEAGVRF